jgi:hypothetical protein
MLMMRMRKQRKKRFHGERLDVSAASAEREEK